MLHQERSVDDLDSDELGIMERMLKRGGSSGRSSSSSSKSSKSRSKFKSYLANGSGSDDRPNGTTVCYDDEETGERICETTPDPAWVTPVVLSVLFCCGIIVLCVCFFKYIEKCCISCADMCGTGCGICCSNMRESYEKAKKNKKKAKKAEEREREFADDFGKVKKTPGQTDFIK